MQAEEQKGDEVEEGRPGYSLLGPEHTSGNDGCNGVGRVMQAIEKVEEQRDADQARSVRKGKTDVHGLHVLDHDAVDLVGNILQAVHHLFQIAVDLDANQKAIAWEWPCLEQPLRP